MKILWLLFIHVAATPAQGYGSSWHDLPPAQPPSFQRPVDVMTDVINDLGVRILQEYGETGGSGNVAFSPTGIGFVLAALYEGSAGPGNAQIAHVLALPRDKDVTRIGLRDIHRRLRSYLSPDGFLGGLTLNRENTKLRSDYENVLKFLGFDVSSDNDGNNATDSSTSVAPESTSEVATTPTIPFSNSSPTNIPTSPSATEAPESSTVTSTISTQESTTSVITVTNRIIDAEITSTPVAEVVTETSTSSPKEFTTTSATLETPTTLKSDGDDADVMNETTTVTERKSDPPTTTQVMEFDGDESTTVSEIPTASTATEYLTTVAEVSSTLTEPTSAISIVDETTELLSSTQAATTSVSSEAASEITTSTSVEGTAETTTPGKVTSPRENTLASEATTSMIPETSVAPITESSTMQNPESGEEGKPEIEAEAEMTSPKAEDTTTAVNQEESAPTTTEETSTVALEKPSSNEIVDESTTSRAETTTVSPIAEAETTTEARSSESETSLPAENEKMDLGVPTLSPVLDTDAESSEVRRIRRIGIRDPVVRTLLDAKPEVKVTERSDLVNSKTNGAVWMNGVVEYSLTEASLGETSTPRTILKKAKGNTNEDLTQSSVSEESEIEGNKKARDTRSSRSYFSSFSNLPGLPSFPIYTDFHGYPEESPWTRKVGGWGGVHSPKVDDGSPDSSELTFLVNGEDATVVSAAAYTVVLPFAFLPTLQALALEFPLDDPRYNILLLLPTDRDGTRRLARELGTVSLRELRKELQPAWVRAIIPSFMLKGFVTLTSFLQRLGIRDVFEPRDADLSPMTDDVGVYARDVQQSIGVNIRNYMKPDRTHSRNGLFERAGPVSFVAEHPFLFFIIDAETGVSLITGRIEDPLNSRIL